MGQAPREGREGASSPSLRRQGLAGERLGEDLRERGCGRAGDGSPGQGMGGGRMPQKGDPGAVKGPGDGLDSSHGARREGQHLWGRVGILPTASRVPPTTPWDSAARSALRVTGLWHVPRSEMQPICALKFGTFKNFLVVKQNKTKQSKQAASL